MTAPQLQRLVLKQIIVPLAGIVLLSGLLSLRQSRSALQAQVYSNAESLVQAITPDLMAVHLLQDQLKASEIGARLKAFEEIYQLTAYDSNSQRIYLYEVPKYTTFNAPSVDTPLLEAFEYGDQYIRFKVPIMTNNRVNGFAIVVSSNSDFQNQNRFALFFGLAILLVAIALGTGIHLWLKKQVIIPLSDLALLNQRVAETNDYSIQSPISNSVEISHLQKGFNRMMNAAEASRAEIRSSNSKLQDSKNHLEGLLQTMQDGFLLVHKSGQIHHANKAFLQLFALNTLPLRIQELNVLLKGYSEPNIIAHCLNHQEDSFTIRKTNTHQLLECMAIPIPNGQEAIVLVRDISAEEMARNAQQALQQSQKMEAVGKLAGSVAHDFNNLLTIIVALSFELAQDLEDETQREDAQEIFRAAELAAELTQKLLVFSRKQVSSVQLIDMNAVLMRMQPLLKRLVTESINLDIRPSKLPCWLEGNTSHLEQIIVNLVTNAKEAMASGGRLEISVGTENISTDDPRRGAISPGLIGILKVKDTGSGMNDETLNRIFEPFFTTKGDGHATGLGLPTIKRLVDNMKGHIHIDSQVNVGSAFSILLPLMDDGESTVEEKQALVDPNLFQAHTILVVEDTEPVLRVVVSALERAGHNTLVARDPIEALTLVEREQPQIDLLLTDVRMPQLSGPELLVEIRKLLKSPFPVLYMSGHVDGSAGADSISPEQLIFKPFRAEEIVAKVESVISAQQAKPKGSG